MRLLVSIVVVLLLGACGDPAPVRIGFIGGLSDRNADTGLAGLNGVQLAVQEINRGGGIGGRMVDLVVRDDAQSREVAARAARELVEAGVDAVIGPFTSSMAEVIVPILDRAGIFQVSPTITSMTFHGRDDHLFRINRTTRDNARDYARMMAGRGLRRIAVAYDLRNRNFTESWLRDFLDAVAAEGGRVAVAVPYESAPDTDFRIVMKEMLEGRPDSLLFISGAVDVARLAKEARELAPSLSIWASEWAATEQLVRLGGRVINGLLIIQNFDREDASPRYRHFAEVYQQTYQRLPGYPSVMAYEAAMVVFSALRQQMPGEGLKSAALRGNPHPGLQQEIVFDRNGDTQRQVVFTEIRDGNYRRVAR